MTADSFFLRTFDWGRARMVRVPNPSGRTAESAFCANAVFLQGSRRMFTLTSRPCSPPRSPGCGESVDRGLADKGHHAVPSVAKDANLERNSRAPDPPCASKATQQRPPTHARRSWRQAISDAIEIGREQDTSTNYTDAFKYVHPIVKVQMFRRCSRVHASVKRD